MLLATLMPDTQGDDLTPIVSGDPWDGSVAIRAMAAGSAHVSALALNAVSRTGANATGYGTACAWLARAGAIAERLDDAPLRAQVAACRAGVEVAAGHWTAVYPAALRAMPLLRASGLEASWEGAASLNTARAALLWSGEIAALRDLIAEHRAAARRLGNHFVESFCRVHSWFIAALDDDAPRGLADLAEATASWSSLGFHAIHFWALYGGIHLELYRGDPAAAVARWDANASAIARSRTLDTQVYRVVTAQARGAARLTLATHETGRVRSKLLGAVDHDARSLSRERTTYASAAAAALRAGVATARGEMSDARVAWDHAVRDYDTAGMRVHAACARVRRDEIASDGRTALEAAAGLAVLAKEGVQQPARWIAMYAPSGR